MISGTEVDVYGNCKAGVNFAVSLFCSTGNIDAPNIIDFVTFLLSCFPRKNWQSVLGSRNLPLAAA